jgi:photosystem II stability/assembly factor-like uncharacterized protein
MTKTYNSKDNGALWAQPSGPNTKPEYWGCRDLDAIAIDNGSVTLTQCLNADGQFETIGFVGGAPGIIKTAIKLNTGKQADLLETTPCPFWLHASLRCTGKADVFVNWERGFMMQVLNVTKETIEGLATRDKPATTEQTFEVEIAPPLARAFRLNLVKETTYEVKDGLDVFVLDNARCAGSCGPAIAAGDYAAFTTDVLAASSTTTANVQLTSDGGGAWAANATDPFAAGHGIASGVAFQVGQSTWRYLVAIGTTTAGVAMKVAYSDNAGLTWATVTVGSVLAQYATKAKTLFAYNANDIWLACTGGYIYHSVDGGLTWTAQTSGGVTVQNLNAIHFPKGDVKNGFAVGAANAILKTSDGGVVWAAVTGPVAQAAVAINGVFCQDALRVWITYADGKLYFTLDGGTTWTQRTHPLSASGSLIQVGFVNDMVGFFIHNTAAPVGSLYLTRDGGYTWEAVQLSGTNAGLNAFAIVNERTVYVVGKVYSGTAYIAKTEVLP